MKLTEKESLIKEIGFWEGIRAMHRSNDDFENAARKLAALQKKYMILTSPLMETLNNERN